MRKEIATAEALRNGWRRIERGSLYCEVPEPVSLAGRFAKGAVQGMHPGGKFILYPGDLLVGYVLNTNKKGKDLQAQKKSILYYLANRFCQRFKSKLKGVHFTKTNCDLLAKNNKKFGASVSHAVELSDRSIISIHFLISVVKSKQKTKEILVCEKTADYKGSFPKRTRKQICATQDFKVTYNDLVTFFTSVTCTELEQLDIDYSTGEGLAHFKNCE